MCGLFYKIYRFYSCNVEHHIQKEFMEINSKKISWDRSHIVQIYSRTQTEFPAAFHILLLYKLFQLRF